VSGEECPVPRAQHYAASPAYLNDSLADLGDARALIRAGCADLAHGLGHALDRAHDLGHRRARMSSIDTSNWDAITRRQCSA